MVSNPCSIRRHSRAYRYDDVFYTTLFEGFDGADLVIIRIQLLGIAS
ncbi:MAG: hypothetical protein P1U68_09600 [Verrucomicrobiales bacterium]|nr:hypothetical protein [Verrucomicrobiales bacterium]